MSRRLNIKQATFVKLYTDITSDTYGNATRSAIKAGYTVRSAQSVSSRLLSNVIVKAEIDRFKSESILTPEKIKELLSKLGSEAKRESDKIRAIEVLSKIIGLQRDTTNVVVQTNFQDVLDKRISKHETATNEHMLTSEVA